MNLREYCPPISGGAYAPSPTSGGPFNQRLHPICDCLRAPITAGGSKKALPGGRSGMALARRVTRCVDRLRSVFPATTFTYSAGALS